MISKWTKAVKITLQHSGLSEQLFLFFRSASNGKLIYDIAESDEHSLNHENGLVILHTNNGGRRTSAPHKPPRSKRSQSFTPASKSTEHLSTNSRAKSYEPNTSKEDIHVSSLIVVGTTPLKSSSASSLLSSNSTSEAKTPEKSQSQDHIYEEIQSSERKDSHSKRPLPPIPGHKGT